MVAMKSMGEIVWVAGENQSDSCPAVSQGVAPGKARGRSHAVDSGAVGLRRLTGAEWGAEFECGRERLNEG